MKRLSVLVVAHDAAPLLGRFLGALAPEIAALDAEVVLVDNASRDGTADLVKLRHPWVRLVRSGTHLGWAGGVNLAASHAHGRTLALLRQDVLVERGALERGLRAVERDPLIGLASGTLLDGQGVPAIGACPRTQAAPERFARSGLAGAVPCSWPCGARGGAVPPDRPAGPTQRVCGAFAFMPRDLFDALGGLDPRFFHAYETQDFCRRLRALGLRVQHLCDVRARCVPAPQDGSASPKPPPALWCERSALLYRRKHGGWLAAWLDNRLQRLGHALRGRLAAWRGQAELARAETRQGALLAQAWCETLGGRLSPPQPW
ncbi:glycosyltransferase family 2 protein [Azohydromonas lata]|uniref:glycosyltransferase family 2 protein n=1 Tax=Azohydromonas lata TaxID=45677 RepID=UPI0012F48200|nr:glycosyltransferase family 2 protein [Azohydromonas lata]